MDRYKFAVRTLPLYNVKENTQGVVQFLKLKISHKGLNQLFVLEKLIQFKANTNMR